MIRENIGENIRSLRKREGRCSAARVVDQINALGYEVSIDTYYKWERGVRQPPSDVIPFLARVFGVSESTLFHLRERENHHVDALDLLIKEESQNMSQKARQLLIWIIANWSGEIEKVLIYLGMYSCLEEEDQIIMKTLLRRLYKEEKIQDGELRSLIEKMEIKK